MKCASEARKARTGGGLRRHRAPGCQHRSPRCMATATAMAIDMAMPMAIHPLRQGRGQLLLHPTAPWPLQSIHLDLHLPSSADSRGDLRIASAAARALIHKAPEDLQPACTTIGMMNSKWRRFTWILPVVVMLQCCPRGHQLHLACLPVLPVPQASVPGKNTGTACEVRRSGMATSLQRACHA